jgi:hypothetical protein
MNSRERRIAWFTFFMISMGSIAARGIPESVPTMISGITMKTAAR